MPSTIITMVKVTITTLQYPEPTPDMLAAEIAGTLLNHYAADNHRIVEHVEWMKDNA